MPVIREVELLFHHIYSQRKRQRIAEWALGRTRRDDAQLPVHAVMKIGKPGRLLAIGRPAHVHSFILRVKGLHWQSVKVDGTSEHEVDDCTALDEHSFQEVEQPTEYALAIAAVRSRFRAR